MISPGDCLLLYLSVYLTRNSKDFLLKKVLDEYGENGVADIEGREITWVGERNISGYFTVVHFTQRVWADYKKTVCWHLLDWPDLMVELAVVYESVTVTMSTNQDGGCELGLSYRSVQDWHHPPAARPVCRPATGPGTTWQRQLTTSTSSPLPSSRVRTSEITSQQLSPPAPWAGGVWWQEIRKVSNGCVARQHTSHHQLNIRGGRLWRDRLSRPANIGIGEKMRR